MTTSDPNETLYEIVESGRLVFFTGSGSSADLLNLEKQQFPSWLKLLRTIRAERCRQGKIALDSTLLEVFLDDNSDGQSLIEAASILREGFEEDFDKLIARNLTPSQECDQIPENLNEHLLKQKLLFDLHPRGIVTVNVDELHENYLKSQGFLDRWNFADPLQAGGDKELRKALIEIDRKPFLVKAHGTSGKITAFDFHTYRRLLSESPVYQMFMLNLFINFNIIFFGFGLSDLDFDFFLQSQALTFGEPIRAHVALVKKKDTKTAKSRAALLTRRFGIQYLWYDDHPEVPGILERAGKTPGSRLKTILQGCLDRNDKVRSDAHSDLGNLGPAGKHVAVLAVTEEVKQLLSGTQDNWFKLSEYVYTLGKIDPPLHEDRKLCRRILLESLQKTQIKEVAAHAILALEKLATIEDADFLQELWGRSFWKDLLDLPEAPDPENRIPVYLRCLILRLRAKSLAKAP